MGGITWYYKVVISQWVTNFGLVSFQVVLNISSFVSLYSNVVLFYDKEIREDSKTDI